MVTQTALPGLTAEIVHPPEDPSPLRSDIAGVIGRTRRGPLGTPLRVNGWRDVVSQFGGLDTRYATGYALRGYVDNGGQVAYVLRVGGANGSTAAEEWTIGNVPAAAGFKHLSYKIEATSPGDWANETQVTITYLTSGPLRQHELSVRIEVPGESPEFFSGISPETVVEQVTSSRFIRITPDDAGGPPAPPAASGPSVKPWKITLTNGADPEPGLDDYLQAVQRLGEEVEVAMVLVPDLHTDLDSQAVSLLRALLRDAVDRQDRLVFVDLPVKEAEPTPAVAWVDGLSAGLEAELLRAAAVYHPWVRVRDPLGGSRKSLRDVPPSGHVAGLASRLDRERGAQHTPANALLADAVDVTTPFDRDQQAVVVAGKINLVRCRPGRGLEVWGGRTLDPDPARTFIAHRRLLHRLVRAIRRVAEPLVFEPEGPVLRFALVREISSVLLEAWRAGGLKGNTPDEGFRVRCDEGNNPPELTELGQLQCEILLAPAVPMEFIRILLTLAPQGVLAVVEA
jgi:hypothetical protein